MRTGRGGPAGRTYLQPGELTFGAWAVDPRGSAEDLYFEALRLHSSGLLSRERLAELHASLAVVDSVYARDAQHAWLLRDAILSHLRRASAEVRREDTLALEAHLNKHAEIQPLPQGFFEP